MRIPESKIDEIRNTADIVDVINGYIPLKRRGRNYLAKCPFHDEKTPSFSVSRDKQIYHCFGCGQGGNVFSFLMEYEKLTFVEAVKSLAGRYGVILPAYKREEDDRYERLLYANQTAAEFYQATAKKPQYRTKIEKYLFQTRGLTPETVEEFKIGLAPSGWSEFLDYARKKDLTDKELAEAGLIIKSEKTGDYFDRFRLRLMTPIFNMTGKIVAFGGRALKKGEYAKYMNSPETPIYNKSNILYGLNFSKKAIRESGTVVLVEGYFDLLSLYQAGIKNVVAVSGTSFTTQQATLLGRLAQKAYLFFDADSAGRAAALRSVEFFFNAGVEPLIITPPPKHDPDSFVREKGPEEVYKLFEKGVPYLASRFEKTDFGAMTMREKEQLVREIRTLGAKIDDPLRRELFLASASQMFNLPKTTFDAEIPAQTTTPREPEQVRDINVIESEFLALFFDQPLLIEQVWDDISPDDLKGPGHSAIFARLLQSYRQTGEINADKMIEEIEDSTEKSGFSFISTLDRGGLEPASAVGEYKKMLLNRKRDAALAEIKARLRQAEKEGDKALAEKLTREIKYLLEKRT